PPTDVDTTGSTAAIVAQVVVSAADAWIQSPHGQLRGGFAAGVALGLVPFAGIGQQLLDAAEVLPPGTPEARRGLAIGQIVGGIFTTLGGVTGGVIGAVETSTGVGAVAGVPTMAASARLIAGGVGNIAAGIRGLSQSMMSKGSGSTRSQPPSNAGGGAGTKPVYKPNPAHSPGKPGFNPRKTIEPSDAASVYKSAIQGSNGKWYGRAPNGEIYRFAPDNAGGAHFNGSTGGPNGLSLDDIPIAVRRTLGRIR
ncbi:MAG: hypothetical protein L6Q76_29965, partial [Polyangiaceae bacterium]|nr:hypothetical protein [Polyangiaceae bacterium]